MSLCGALCEAISAQPLICRSNRQRLAPTPAQAASSRACRSFHAFRQSCAHGPLGAAQAGGYGPSTCSGEGVQGDRRRARCSACWSPVEKAVIAVSLILMAVLDVIDMSRSPLIRNCPALLLGDHLTSSVGSWITPLEVQAERRFAAVPDQTKYCIQSPINPALRTTASLLRARKTACGSDWSQVL